MGEFKEFEINELTKTNLLKKNIAGLIDAFLVIIIYNVLINLYRILYEGISETVFLNVLTLFILYRLITILTLKRTIGMIVLKIKFLKENSNKFTFKEKLLSVIMIYINDIDCYDSK